MKLSYFTRGTKLIVFEEIHNRAVSNEHEAVVRYHEDETRLVVSCPWLYDNYDRLNLGSKLNVSFDQGDVVHSFTAAARSKLRGGNQIMLEQLTEIETTQRRKFERDELRVNVKVYGLPESKVSSGVFDGPATESDLADVSYDISSGGLCVITNTLLSSKHDPYYLVEFNLTSKDSFLLPAKLVRRSNYPHTRVGKYDYGFQFIFDNLPEEKGRLTAAILNRKIQGNR